MYTVSVIIPVYNTGKYLIKCIESLEKQTFQDFEVIIINDGSTDDSENIINSIVSSSNIKINILNKKNEGQAAARNDGIKIAQGEYIVCIDSDDYVGNEYIERLVVAAKKNDSESVTCGLRMVDEEENVLRKISLSNIDARKRAGMLIACCKLYKKSFLDKNSISFPENRMLYEDVPYALCAKHMAKNPVMIEYDEYYYVQRSGSTMHSGGINSARFPYDEFEKAIKKCIETIDDSKMVYFEYEMMHFFTGFLFRYCRKSKKDDINNIIDFVYKIMNLYFPKCTQNQNLKIRKNKFQPILDKVAIKIFSIMYKTKFLRKFTLIVTRI